MAAKFNYVKKGYDPSEVDEYIDNLENIIKSYKEKDTAIKNAILSAQIAADNIVQNAKFEAQDIKSSAANQLGDIASSVAIQRNMLDDFKNEYNAMTEKYLRKIVESDFNRVNTKIDNLEKYLRQFQPQEQSGDSRTYDRISTQLPKSDKADKTDKLNANSDSLTVPNPLNAPTLK